MEQISQIEKDKLINFIKENDLDYNVVDGGISKFHLITYDNYKLFFYKFNNEFIITKYDPKKDNINNPASIPYEYFNFKTFTQVLEQILYYDKQLSKNYWDTTSNTLEVGFDKDGYEDEWHKEFVSDDEHWGLEDSDLYKMITYNNPNYKPELKSPYNNLHEVSPINTETYTKIDKLYFEIHPVCCKCGREMYLLKLACNNEEVLKEYINYVVRSKKGLKLLIDTIFKSLERFKE